MATKTFTIDTGEWLYPDRFGINHTVTNGETFTMTLTDNGASDVVYQIDQAQSVATDDGLTISFRPGTKQGQFGSNSNVVRAWGVTADAQETVNTYGLAGEIDIECPVSGAIQHWTTAQLLVNNADTPTEIGGTFEDQYGNSFTWTTITVA